MKMFVANCTSQRQEFIYRVPEVQAPRIQSVEIGRQVQLSGDLSTRDIDFIVKQHAKYGFVKVDQIDRTRPFTGLCWDEKPISVEKVKKLWMSNQAALTQIGREHRAAAAVATNNAVEEQMPGGLKSLEMEVVEVPTDKNPSPSFEEQVRVTPDESETNGKGFVEASGSGNKSSKGKK